MTLTFAPRSDTEEFRDTGLCRASCPLGVCSVCLMWERGPGTAQFLLCSPRGGGGGWGGEFRPSSGHLAAGTGPPCSQASSPACFALRNPSNPQPHSFYLRSGPPCFGQNHLRFCLLHFVWCKRQGADGILLTDGEETRKPPVSSLLPLCKNGVPAERTRRLAGSEIPTEKNATPALQGRVGSPTQIT